MLHDLFAYVDVVAVVVIVVTATIPFHVKAARSSLSLFGDAKSALSPSLGPSASVVVPSQSLQPLVALNTLIGGLGGANLTPERTID